METSHPEGKRLGYHTQRLLSLLSSNVSVKIRSNAAGQIADMLMLNKSELPLVIDVIKCRFQNDSWDVRIGAAECLGALILKFNLHQHFAKPNKKIERTFLTVQMFDSIKQKIKADDMYLYSGRLSPAHVDDQVPRIKSQKALLGSTICGRRATIPKELQIDFAKCVTDDDLKRQTDAKEMHFSDFQSLVFGTNYCPLVSVDHSLRVSSDMSNNVSIDDSLIVHELVEWILSAMFDRYWEKRHGALLALKEFLKAHSRTKTISESQCEFIADICVRLMSLMVADQFADYLSDQVVPPVRETSAICLALACSGRAMPIPLLDQILKNLAQILTDEAWSIRHASLLTIKYLLPLSDYACTREGIWVHPLIELLEDDDNDVSTAATSCLLYLIPSIEQELSSDELCALVQKLNDFSAHFDDLSSSSYVVTLISKLMPLVQRSKAFDKTLLYQMLDSLWKSVDAPVRMECLHCIDKMLRLIMNYEHVQLEYVVNDVVMIDKVLRMLFGRIYFELNPVLTDKYINTFSTCIDRVSAKPRVLLKLTYDCMTSMIRALTLEELKGVEIANICGVRVDGYEQIGDAFKLRFDTMNKVNRDCTKVRTWFACAKCFAHMVARTLVAVGSIDDLKEGDNDPSEIQRALLDRIAHGYDSGSLIDSMRGQHRIIIYIIIAEIAEALRGMTFFGEEKSEIDVWYLSPFRSIEHVQSVFRPSLDRNIAGESQVFIEVADCIRNAEKIYQILRQKLLQNSKSAAGALPATLYAVSDMDEFRQSLLNMMDEKIRYMYESMIELINESRSIESTILTRTTALAATGLIRLNAYDPAKLNPIIAPLINSIKHDVNPFIRACTADSICRLFLIIKDNRKSLFCRLLNDIIGYLTEPANLFDASISGICTYDRFTSDSDNLEAYSGPMSLQYNIPPFKAHQPLFSMEEFPIVDYNQLIVTESSLANKGAKLILQTACKMLGKKLFNVMPQLIQLITEGVSSCLKSNEQLDLLQTVRSLRLLQELSEHCLGDECIRRLWNAFAVPLADCVISQKFKCIRYEGSIALASLVCRMKTPHKIRNILTEHVLCRLQGDVTLQIFEHIQGAIEALYQMILRFDPEDIVAFCDILMVPILKASRHSDVQISTLAGQCLALLVRLYPLTNTNKTTKNKAPFVLDLLLKPKEIPDHNLSRSLLKSDILLRDYQQVGINWLFMLRDHNLNGILCDDMGLGKTLQTICLLTTTHDEHKQETSKPSLIVCPNSVIHHWYAEFGKFIINDHFNYLLYYGKPRERDFLKDKLMTSSIHFIIVSYDTLRTDADFFHSLKYTYLVLDEGHVIRSSKSMISQVIQNLKADHRLILSGTPVQNSVQDLWCLFSFLMPGYLGSERHFKNKFLKSITASKNAGGAASDEAILALTYLQKQVLPFMLRRMKQDVVKSLPPKIIQDVYCEMTEIQRVFYDQYLEQNSTLEPSICSEEFESTQDGHVFRQLIKLRRLCNHPCLFTGEKSDDATLEQSGKLIALLNLLRECGFDTEGTSSLHRVLIFCQMREMISIIVSMVIPLLSSAKHLVMHGGVQAAQRAKIVEQYNEPNSPYNILIMTTQVGGVGLNLTAADTVIFVEHDWNPAKDQQAMDRAHRIGQTRTVNVYRLLTKDTIEEKIMNIQKFKSRLSKVLVDQTPLLESSHGLVDGHDSVLDRFAMEDAPNVIDSSQSHDQRMHSLANEKAQKYAEEFDAEKLASSAKRSRKAT